MKKSTIVIVLIFTFIIGIFIGRHLHYQPSSEKKPLYWIDSMEPAVHHPGPGKSRMGMDLIPVYPDQDAIGDQSSVRISPAIINNLGVRVAPVIQETLGRQIETVGYIEPNENKISHIHSYADGWVRNLLVRTVGESVQKNQVLLQLYSPILISVQQEYLVAIKSGSKILIDGSINKLRTFHISEKQIEELKITKKPNQLVDIISPQDGIVDALNIREGMRVTPETEMMSLVDLSSIWMIAQIFEDQANWVKVGEEAIAKLSAFPDKTWRGEVEYIYPQVDPTTRTLKIRFRFENKDHVLKPNMYANITLFTEPKSNVVTIPIEALIQSSRGNRVIVSLGQGRFQSRSVETGIESEDKIEILFGLKPGEAVVTSGQFLIDSETNLKAGLDRIEIPANNAKIEGKGIIKKINLSTYQLTLQHEAIPALNWPEMTMDFSVDKNITLNQFKTGEQVQFVFKKDEKNNYIITELKK